MPRGIQKTAYEAAEILGVSLAEVLEADGKATASHSKVSMKRVRDNLKKISDNERLKIQLGAEFFQGEPTPASEDWHSAQKAEAEPQSEPEPKPKPGPRPKLESKPKPKPKPVPKPKVKPEPEVKPESEPKLEIEPKPKAKPKPVPKPKAKPEVKPKPKPEPEPIDGLLERMARLGF
jgi:hypothetical protein